MGHLAGKRIAVTRPGDQGGSFADLLSERGASVLSTPLIKIVPTFDPEALREVLAAARRFDWICFTSANGVRIAMDFAERNNLSAGIREVPVACIGPATAKALKARGVEASLIPETYQAEGLLDVFKKQRLHGKKFLLLRAAGARAILREDLAAQGALVTEMPIYESVPDRGGMDLLGRALRNGEIDCVTFTSSSTVRAFSGLLQESRIDLDKKKTILSSIGPVTSATLAESGLWVDVEAAVSTTEGLTNALEDFYGKQIVGMV